MYAISIFFFFIFANSAPAPQGTQTILYYTRVCTEVRQESKGLALAGVVQGVSQIYSVCSNLAVAAPQQSFQQQKPSISSTLLPTIVSHQLFYLTD